MATPIDVAVAGTSKTLKSKAPKLASKSKKDKPSKNRKAEGLDEVPEKAIKLAHASTPDDGALSAPKGKKDKPSKKRKAESLDEAPQKSTKFADASSSDEGFSVAAPESASQVVEETSEQPPSKKRKASVEEIEVDITAPEPPSKKALRRLKKGKPLPPSKSGAESTPEPEKKQAKKSEVEKRSEHGIWIGNLPWHLSKEDLRKFFVEYSDITEEMITRVHMPTPNDGKPANKVEEKKKFVKVVNNQGYAYVDFNCSEAVGYVIELSEQLLGGRRVLIKNNKSFEGRPQKTKEESRNDGKPPSKRVFLGNLSFDTTEDSLKEHFEKCGAIANVKVAQFEDSGKCKGYAWITFEELEGAENAVRGFVRIEEDLSDASESEPEDEASDSEGVRKTRPKKTKTRKWWVNKIKGRPLRMEFAEDAQVRYKKRYGKDGTKSRPTESLEGATEGIREKIREIPKKVEYMLPHGSARLTGGIVESTGKKVTF
ncbi:putative RNA-binding protein rnp24 [Hyaloscypha finlandica]|nr:putative RNA-binding protein rnp24 [Hyaloscypha finlandica]